MLQRVVNYEKKGIFGDYSQHSFSKTIVVDVRLVPELQYSIMAAESLFAGDIFPVTVVIENVGVKAKDITVTVIPSDNLTIVGQNKHSLSMLEAGQEFKFEFELKVSDDTEEASDRLLQIRTSYVDGNGEEHESTDISLVRQTTWISGDRSIGRILDRPSIHFVHNWRR